MRMVIDTDKWHPVVRTVSAIAVAVLVVELTFGGIEYFWDVKLQWWRGYTLGLIIGFTSNK